MKPYYWASFCALWVACAAPNQPIQQAAVAPPPQPLGMTLTKTDAIHPSCFVGADGDRLCPVTGEALQPPGAEGVASASTTPSGPSCSSGMVDIQCLSPSLDPASATDALAEDQGP